MTRSGVPAGRRIFCNRTLNLRAIRAVGFDMDYTLVHYHAREWEHRSYELARRALVARGWPLQDLEFDAARVSLGLVLDLELGNLVKANRFGYVSRACHGTHPVAFERQRELYSRVLVDLEEPRWVFLNTLFSLSAACLYSQLVDLLDAGKLGTAVGYRDLHGIVSNALDHVHAEGELKRDISADPARYVDRDPELGLCLQDLKAADKRLLLITNSEWSYTQAMMSFALEPQLPAGTSWRDLFDLVIVEARKPSFFSQDARSFRIVSPEGLLRTHAGEFRLGDCYLGGSARMVEQSLGVPGEQILYIGDHIAADVRASKDLWRWRTGLVLRDLEGELEAAEAFAERQATLVELMERKMELENEASQIRLQLQRLEAGYGPPPSRTSQQLWQGQRRLREELSSLDARIAPLARAASDLYQAEWGPLLRSGHEQSHLARQIERSADIYMSRVSNLLHATPYAYLRAPSACMPHDRS